jgi:hypothetical protein
VPFPSHSAKLSQPLPALHVPGIPYEADIVELVAVPEVVAAVLAFDDDLEVCEPPPSAVLLPPPPSESEPEAMLLHPSAPAAPTPTSTATTEAVPAGARCANGTPARQCGHTRSLRSTWRLQRAQRASSMADFN